MKGESRIANGQRKPGVAQFVFSPFAFARLPLKRHRQPSVLRH